MRKNRAILVGVPLVLSLAFSGCKRTKPPVPPPQAQAPTITDTNVPATIPEVPVPQPSPEPVPTKPAPSVSRKSKPRTRIETKKNSSPPQPSPPSAGDKVIVEEGSKQPDPAQPPLVASEGSAQATQLRQNTNQLLSAAEYNINNLHRTLSTDDQTVIQHIRGFIDQSRQAMKDGDMDRAYNLATKARLMSDELVKR